MQSDTYIKVKSLKVKGSEAVRVYNQKKYLTPNKWKVVGEKWSLEVILSFSRFMPMIKYSQAF